jgi:hypothetical protein
MKMKKNKVNQFLKTGILFFGISLLLLSCEKDPLLPLEKVNNQLNNELDYNLVDLTYLEASTEFTFSKLKTKFEIEEPILNPKKGNHFSKVKNIHSKSKNSKDFSALDASIDMSSLKKITTENYISYTMRLEEPLNTSNSFSNIVIQENNGIQEIFTVKYTPSQAKTMEKSTSTSSEFEGSFTMKSGIIPYDGWDETGDDTGGGTSDFVEICESRSVITLIPCQCTHDAGNYCTGCSGPGTFHYTITTEQFCYFDYIGDNNTYGGNGDTGGNPNTGGGNPTNTGGNVITTPIRSELVDDALETIAECIEPDDEQVNWINKQNSSDATRTNLVGIWNLITETNCSDDAKNFIYSGIKAEKEGAEINWEEQIINKLTDPCAKDIFTELENGIFEDHPLKPEVQVTVSNPLTLNFSESILKLFNDSDYTHLIIQNGNAGNSNAFTVGATITIGDTYLENATQLSIARTMIHESVHTYINALYSNVVTFNSFSFQQKMEKYAADNGYTIGTNEFHHNFMGQYIDAMAYSLNEWDKTYGTGGNLGWEYYQSMVYSGMFQVYPSGIIATEIDTFKKLVPNESDRQAIADIIMNEQNGNNDAQGTECN